MADFVAPRHSAVMERLRRRIELFRRHHTSCESRYDNTAMDRLEMDQQQTFALHQRCLQTKAKRSSKHRQPQPASDQTGLRATGTGSSNVTDPTDSATAESRNNTRLARSALSGPQSAALSRLGFKGARRFAVLRQEFGTLPLPH
ncbi:hypothetical protein SKAU_G00380140 [Synaphobranchus kaupii]|uniref:Neurogenic mastermind-like N-terminal domain-containing protein n=1 Tax=Synaphobranchus kaupii TaxID=118154 RepID=A0A9Q1IEL5_SYNKA|nr:hypothetical protein SKAU_G00380140 [Synaphobranchus kaupii]